MSHQYSTPPFEEIHCTFNFMLDQEWDITLFGLLYEKMKARFPKKKIRLGFDMDIQYIIPSPGQKSAEIKISPPLQLLNLEETAYVQVGPGLFSIHHCKPYPTWAAFKGLILDTLKEYHEVAKPNEIKSINLEYVNKIGFDTKPLEVSDYLNCYPIIPKVLPKLHQNIKVHVDIPYGSRGDKLHLNLAETTPEKPHVFSLRLEIGYRNAKTRDITVDKMSPWLEEAHTTLANVFESCITEKCRNLFK